MGLDLFQNDTHIARWSYSGFHEFRKRLAKAIGIDLDNMDGFGGKLGWDTCNSPLRDILDHPDCEGSLVANPELGKALREAVAQWSDDEDTDEGYDKKQALELVAALEDVDGGEIQFS